jgi:hypothetical protein
METMDEAQVASSLKETMTPEERLQAAIALQPVDRVPCALFPQGYAAAFAGVTQARFYNDFDLALGCMKKLKAAYPAWDIFRSSYVDLGYSPSLRNRWFQKVALPGEELPEDAPYQIREESLASQDDLRAIKMSGFPRYMFGVGKRIRPAMDFEHFQKWEAIRDEMHRKEVAATRERGQAHYYGGTLAIPLEVFSMTRGMNDFTMDMYRMKGELVEIMWAAQEDTVGMAIGNCQNSQVKRAFVTCTRCGTGLLNRKQFETFSWPFLKDGVLKLIQAGITPIFHLDTDWGLALEHFLELPKGKCIIETDGQTDLFRAKEILKDHTCLSGDIPPALLTVAGASEVEEYCRKLIQVVGKGGGFILNNGCTMPPNSRHENVKAIFTALEKYGQC